MMTGSDRKVRHYVSGDEISWKPAPDFINDVSKFDSFPKLLRQNALIAPHAVAQREKEFGIWQSISWLDFHHHVERIAVGFAALGLGPGDVVGLIGDNRPEWVWCEIAAHACRAMSLGIYRDTLEPELKYFCDSTALKVVIAEDEEQIFKFLNLGDEIPSVQKIIYHDHRGMRKYDDPRLISMEALEALGQEKLDKDPDLYERMVDATRGDEVAILCTTSGTTSNPKLAKWRIDALLRHAHNYLRADPHGPEDDYLAVLPLPWVMEQMYSIAWNLVARMKINFSEEGHTAMADLREIGPSFILLSPRVWEVVVADIKARSLDSSRWKRAIYDWAVKTGMKARAGSWQAQLTELLLFRALRNRLGFSRLKSAATGGAAMGPDTFRYLQTMGLPLKQLYGQTEAMGAHTIHRQGDVDNETVGYPMPNCEICIKNPDSEGLGEILVRHPNMMSGYFGAERDMADEIDDDGWFCTGDAGYLTASKHLIVIDRVSDLAQTSAGTRFSPQFVENKLKFSPYIAEAVILGKDKPYLAAMICIRFPILSKWAEERRISFTTYTDLASRAEVYALIRGEVEKVNETLTALHRIHKFILLYKELDADDGELTRTRKVRRKVVIDKYRDIIDTLYSAADSVHIDTVINFQDGSSQPIVTDLKIERLEVEQSGRRAGEQAA